MLFQLVWLLKYVRSQMQRRRHKCSFSRCVCVWVIYINGGLIMLVHRHGDKLDTWRHMKAINKSRIICFNLTAKIRTIPRFWHLSFCHLFPCILSALICLSKRFALSPDCWAMLMMRIIIMILFLQHGKRRKHPMENFRGSALDHHFPPEEISHLRN